jgi:2-polyprenyl-6-methoxyphenol hydroxylase-like FAD-dependent oxidoreductase
MENSDYFYFDSMTQVKMPTWTKGRIALVGDAGYCPSPFSGQGTGLALIGAYLLAGELKNAGENYSLAFERYHTLLCPLVEASQNFGLWASETFFIQETITKEALETRSGKIMKKMQTLSDTINLPEY